jgi:hypothetical protein
MYQADFRAVARQPVKFEIARHIYHRHSVGERRVRQGSHVPRRVFVGEFYKSDQRFPGAGDFSFQPAFVEIDDC